MSKNMNFLMRLVVSLSFLVFIVGCNAATAQTEMTGDWSGSLGREKSASVHRQMADEPEITAADEDSGAQVKGDRLYLDFERPTKNGHRSQMGQTYSFSELLARTEVLARRRGSREVAARFSPDRLADETLAVYQTVTGRSRKAR